MMPLSLLSSVELGVVMVVMVVTVPPQGPEQHGGGGGGGLSAEPELSARLERGLSVLGDAVLSVSVEHGLAP